MIGASGGLLTAGDVIGSAFNLIGLTGPDDYVTGAEQALAMQHLNWMLKSWQADGCNLWRDTDLVVTWSAGATAQELTGVLDVFDARWTGAVDAAPTSERPLSRWERAEYNTLPNKTTVGTPTCYTVVKGAAASNDGCEVRVWPLPSVDGRLLCDAARVANDVVDPTQPLDLPQEWTETAYTDLAARLAVIWPVAADARANVQSRAAALRSKLLDFDRPGSIIMEPESEYRYSSLGWGQGRW